jgi:hypothetical protein
LWFESRANTAYEAWRARGVMSNGRKMSASPKPYVAPQTPAGKTNVTDPDSRNLKAFRGYLQGYNAQAVVTEDQIVVAAEVNADSPDFGHLEPMVTAAQSELHAAGVAESPEIVVADTGYWHQVQMEAVVDRGIQVIIPPDASKANRHPAGLGRRALRVHAPSHCERRRRRALPKTPGDD